MNELLLKAFDFGVRVIELSNYLNDEKKPFPLTDRLLGCGTGIGACLRVSDTLQKTRQEQIMQACKLAAETEYMLELMVKTGFLTEMQSGPMLSDCRSIKEDLVMQNAKRNS